ncbi:hypothetical protein Q1695_007279 [Nippostrongylus brasiliensis]|nr:hypothetical protein Q1695_007279 [Nippostrongylus brasiliensis]
MKLVAFFLLFAMAITCLDAWRKCKDTHFGKPFMLPKNITDAMRKNEKAAALMRKIFSFIMYTHIDSYGENVYVADIIDFFSRDGISLKISGDLTDVKEMSPEEQEEYRCDTILE